MITRHPTPIRKIFTPSHRRTATNGAESPKPIVKTRHSSPYSQEVKIGRISYPFFKQKPVLRPRLQEYMPEPDIEGDDEISIKNAIKNVAETNLELKTMVADNRTQVEKMKEAVQKEEETYKKYAEMELLPVIKTEFLQAFNLKNREFTHKTKVFWIRKSIAELEDSLNRLIEENGKLRIENGKFERFYEEIAVEKHAPPRRNSVLFSILWRALLTTPKTDLRFIKKSLLKSISKYRKVDLIRWLKRKSPEFTDREIAKMMGNAVKAGELCIATFLAVLDEYQPYPVFEDVQELLSSLRVHFSLANYNKIDIQNVLLREFNQPYSLSPLVSALEGNPFHLTPASASLLARFLLKDATEIPSLVSILDWLPDWSPIGLLLTILRYTLSLSTISTSRINQLIPIPCTVFSLQSVLERRFALKEDDALMVSHAVMKDTAIFPVDRFKHVIGPWKCAEEWDCGWIIERLLEWMDVDRLEAVAMRTKVVSGKLRSLPLFLKECEKEFDVQISAEARFAMEVKCFEHTKLLGLLDYEKLKQMNFNSVLKQQVEQSYHKYEEADELITHNIAGF